MTRKTAKSKRLRRRPAPIIRPVSEIVQTFTAELWRGRRPSIEAALDETANDEWPGALRTLLLAEIADRRARGETPVVREYLPRFPAHIDVVRAVFPPPPAGPPTAAESPGPLPAWVRQASLPESPTILVTPPPVPLAVVLPAPAPKAPLVPPASPSARSRRRRFPYLIAAAIFAIVAASGGLAFVRRPDSDPGPPTQALPAPVGPPSVALGPAPLSSKPLARPKAPADPERDLAEWVFALGGRGEVQPDGGLRRPFGPDARLPRTPFAVTGLELPAAAAGAWATADLSRLAGRRSLNSVRLHATGSLTEADLAPLAGCPLRTLELHANPVRVSGAFCAAFSDLETLALDVAPEFGEADLVAVGGLPKLTTLNLNSPNLTIDGFKGLRNPLLKTLKFGDRVALTADHVRVLRRPDIEEFESAAGMTDDTFLEFGLLPDLKRVRLRRTALTDEGLKAVVGLGKLEEFRVDGSVITGTGLEHLAECTGLKSVDLCRSKVRNDHLGALLALPALRELRLAGNPVSDAGVNLLAQLERLELLDLGQTAITDSALGQLAKHPTLKTLIVTNTRVTTRAVVEFEAATPGCKVISERRR